MILTRYRDTHTRFHFDSEIRLPVLVDSERRHAPRRDPPAGIREAWAPTSTTWHGGGLPAPERSSLRRSKSPAEDHQHPRHGPEPARASHSRFQIRGWWRCPRRPGCQGCWASAGRTRVLCYRCCSGQRYQQLSSRLSWWYGSARAATRQAPDTGSSMWGLAREQLRSLGCCVVIIYHGHWTPAHGLSPCEWTTARSAHRSGISACAWVPQPPFAAVSGGRECVSSRVHRAAVWQFGALSDSRTHAPPA